MSTPTLPVPTRFAKIQRISPAAGDVDETRKTATEMKAAPADPALKALSNLKIRIALAPPPGVPLAQVWREETTSYFEGPLND
jgi:hypothetical protein